MANANSSDFSGSYVGANFSKDYSSLSQSPDKKTEYFGLSGGHNWDKNGYVLGANIFYDDHGKAYSGRDYGIDGKLGLPNGNWMPYAKLGWAGSQPGDRAHGGLGIEYKFSDNWHATGEWTTDKKTNNGLEYKNSNFGIGLNYYFKAPKAAPVVAVAAAPVVVQKEPEPIVAPAPAPAPVVAPAPVPVPVAEPAPQPKESWKIIKEQKPVTIEGANFDFDSARLRPTADAKLQPVVEFAKKYPDAGMNVHGHTDSIGTPAYNQKLSERRAASVKAYLVKHGIEASRITAKGFGETEHIADNKTEEGRAKNRRVEIHYTIITEKKIRVTE
jgi:OOP family OmpA-OmpF porin